MFSEYQNDTVLLRVKLGCILWITRSQQGLTFILFSPHVCPLFGIQKIPPGGISKSLRMAGILLGSGNVYIILYYITWIRFITDSFTFTQVGATSQDKEM